MSTVLRVSRLCLDETMRISEKLQGISSTSEEKGREQEICGTEKNAALTGTKQARKNALPLIFMTL